MGVVLDQLLQRGPGACRELLQVVLADLLGYEPSEVEEFLTMLKPMELLWFGQGFFSGTGFDFEAATALCRKKRTQVTFILPTTRTDGRGGEAAAAAAGLRRRRLHRPRQRQLH